MSNRAKSGLVLRKSSSDEVCNHCDKCSGLDWLYEERPEACRDGLLAVRLLRVRTESGCGRRVSAVAGRDPSYEIVAALAHYGDLAEKHVRRRSLELCECLGSRGNGPGLGTVPLEKILQGHAHIPIVVDDENAHPRERAGFGAAAESASRTYFRADYPRRFQLQQ